MLHVHSIQWNAGMGNTDTLHPNSCFCSFSIPTSRINFFVTSYYWVLLSTAYATAYGCPTPTLIIIGVQGFVTSACITKNKTGWYSLHAAHDISARNRNTYKAVLIMTCSINFMKLAAQVNLLFDITSSRCFD